MSCDVPDLSTKSELFHPPRRVVADSTSLSTVRSIIVVAKLAKSFGGGEIPKVLATFATTKSDSYFSNDA